MSANPGHESHCPCSTVDYKCFLISAKTDKCISCVCSYEGDKE